MKTVFLRALTSGDKAAALRDVISGSTGTAQRFDVEIQEFSVIPNSPFAYWASATLRSQFAEHPQFEGDGRVARKGLTTSDDARYVRLWWEPPLNGVDQNWAPYAKGGPRSPFHSDLACVVRWNWSRRTLPGYIGRPGRGTPTVECADLMGFPGLTWPLRASSFSPSIFPTGSVFSARGYVIQAPKEELLWILALTSSSAFDTLFKVCLGRTAYPEFIVGVLQRLPVPIAKLDDDIKSHLAELSHRGWHLRRSIDTSVETSHVFTLPALLQSPGTTLFARADARLARLEYVAAELQAIQEDIDGVSFALYGIDATDLGAIENGFGNDLGDGERGIAETASGANDPDIQVGSRSNMAESPSDEGVTLDDDDDDTGTEGTVLAFASALDLASELMSWAMGVAFGRFDLRIAIGARELPMDPAPFDALPRCSPGMLSEPNGSPALAVPAGYPISPADTGIIVDDPGHADDLGERLRIIFEQVFDSDADAWLSDVSVVLNPGDGDLRKWFSEQFFDYHLRRYSKSKRKAPIYWQLAVPSGRYSVWLYAHRLTNDTFFRLLHDVVAPKLAHEEHRLNALLHGAEAASGRERLEIEAQENFVAELRQMADEVRRIAPLWNPTLDDGIVLGMAPLWRLLPRHKAWQKELRTKWQELQSGRYDWTQLAMHLWPERVVPKCAIDRSLAIAHGLEDVFWSGDENGKWKPRITPLRTIESLVTESTSPAVKEALRSLLEAPEPVASAKRGRKVKAS